MRHGTLRTALIATLLLAGCGGGNDNKSGSGPRLIGDIPVEKIVTTHQHGDHWIYVGVGSYLGRRLVMNQPDVSREAHNRTRDDQINQSEPGVSGYCLHMKPGKFV